MGIKKLIDYQQIRIDSHQRGSGKANTWHPIEDVHLHKIINRKKKESYEIRVPLNSERPITINGYGNKDIPQFIKDEIEEALKNNHVREQFIRDIDTAVANYYSENLSKEQRARQALGHIGKAFGLDALRNVFKDDVNEFYAHLYCTNSIWSYVILSRGKFYISNNTGKWKRFRFLDDNVDYIYSKSVKEVEKSDWDFD